MDYYLKTAAELGGAKDEYLYRGGFYEFNQAIAEEGIKLKISDYDDKAIIWISLFNNHLPRKEELPKVDGLTKVLEIGCNTGYNVKDYEKKYGYAEGIDINARLLSLSVLNHPNCHAMRAEHLEYDDESFSLITAKDVLEHCQSPDSAIKEAYRVLADGGYFVAMIPLDGQIAGVDDVVLHPSWRYGNDAHPWKATYNGVIRRFIAEGFTEIEPHIYTHTELFGEARPFGDQVLVISAQKKVGITKVPDKFFIGNPYWAAFLTFNCTGNCGYCIQHMCKDEFLKAKVEYARNELSAEEWIDFYNNLQRFKMQRLGIIGGEPTIHRQFLEIVNGIEGYYKTVTTNLASPFWNDEAKVMALDRTALRINTSFHPEVISIDDFCNKIHALRSMGFYVDQVAMVDHPLSNFKRFESEFVKRGVAMNPQTYLGKVGEELQPNPNSDLVRDHGEHGIDNYEMYEQGFSGKAKNEVLCMTRRFLVAPDGGIYRCHYHLYSRINRLGNIKGIKQTSVPDYIPCSDYGFCNPCDYPHMKVRPIGIDLSAWVEDVSKNPEMAKNIMEFISDNIQSIQSLLEVVVSTLWSSDDPYWDMYHNTNLHEHINKFINVGPQYDNTNALILAHFDAGLFRYLTHGVNIYRMLGNRALFKYLDSAGFLCYNALQGFDILKDALRLPELTRCLDAITANLICSLGLAHMSDGSFSYWKNMEEVNEE